MTSKGFSFIGSVTIASGVVLLAALLSSTNAQRQEVAHSEKVIKEQPIVIQTQAQDYDQPTLGEYQICHENRDKCLEVCRTAPKRETCKAECPACPILINQDVVVQGINDTDYRAPPNTASGNTTNIIRLTNEIRNIIDNNMGNITARNENNINIHQNISTSGGKYGLGYNANGSCCIVVSGNRRCERQQFSTSARCHHKRQRVCGKNCASRVMYAKRTTKCPDKMQSGNCHQTISYVPYSHSRPVARHATARSNCQYQPQWPFVACHSGGQRQNCHSCFLVPYIDILQHRVPRHCMSCFGNNVDMPNYYSYNYAMPAMPYYPQPYYPEQYYPVVQRPRPPPPSYYDDFDTEDEDLLPGDGWQVERTKCRGTDGRISENCNNDQNWGSGDGVTLVPDPVDPMENLPEPEDELYENDYDDVNDDYLNNEYIDARRRKRQPRNGFTRSLYSRRRNRQMTDY